MDSRPGTTDTDADGRVSRYMRWRLCVGCHALFETKEELTGNVVRPDDRGDRQASA